MTCYGTFVPSTATPPGNLCAPESITALPAAWMAQRRLAAPARAPNATGGGEEKGTAELQTFPTLS